MVFERVGGNCVEVASSADAFRARDNKYTSGPAPELSGRSVEIFLAGVKRDAVQRSKV
ncbi:DUF397 domain-containing protein [Actinosynnema sp. NPDC050801]|uniref:DUF397 domain-containing protein n=1 Tax=unclassified Actinosynnema TaxID=2637065 RepID=UPI0033C19438